MLFSLIHVINTGIGSIVYTMIFILTLLTLVLVPDLTNGLVAFPRFTPHCTGFAGPHKPGSSRPVDSVKRILLPVIAQTVRKTLSIALLPVSPRGYIKKLAIVLFSLINTHSFHGGLISSILNTNTASAGP